MPSRFRDYRRCGVNRISVGAQSFDAKLLQFLGRVHSAEETLRAPEECPSGGIRQFQPGSDLRNSGPDRGRRGPRTSHRRWSASHLTCPPTTSPSRNGTPFHARYRQGLLHPLDEEVEIEMADRIQRTLDSRPDWEALRDLHTTPARASSRDTTSTTGRAATTWASVPAPTAIIAMLERPVGRTVAERALPDRVHVPRRRDRRRRHRARASGTSSSHGGAPVHWAEDDRGGLRTSVSVGVSERNPRTLSPKSRIGSHRACWAEDGQRLRFAPRGLLLANELFVQLV